MKYRSSLLSALIIAALLSCNERDDQQQGKQGEDTVNVSDSRRNTADTINTLPDTARLKVDTLHQSPQ